MYILSCVYRKFFIWSEQSSSLTTPPAHPHLSIHLSLAEVHSRELVTVLAISLLFPCCKTHTWPPHSFMKRGKAILRCPVLPRKSWHLTENYTLTEVKEAPVPPKLTAEVTVWKGSVSFLIAHGIQMYKLDFSNHSQLKPAQSWFNSTSESLTKNLFKVFIHTKKPKPPASVSLIITGDLIITGNFDM